MALSAIVVNGKTLAEETSDEIVLRDFREALDYVGNAYYQGAEGVILREENLGPEFFRLETGLAGELMQKFAQYGVKLAVIGEFDKYESKSLDALIRESNRGNQCFFVADRQAALSRLTA